MSIWTCWTATNNNCKQTTGAQSGFAPATAGRASTTNLQLQLHHLIVRQYPSAPRQADGDREMASSEYGGRKAEWIRTMFDCFPPNSRRCPAAWSTSRRRQRDGLALLSTRIRIVGRQKIVRPLHSQHRDQFLATDCPPTSFGKHCQPEPRFSAPLDPPTREKPRIELRGDSKYPPRRALTTPLTSFTRKAAAPTACTPRAQARMPKGREAASRARLPDWIHGCGRLPPAGVGR